MRKKNLEIQKQNEKINQISIQINDLKNDNLNLIKKCEEYKNQIGGYLDTIDSLKKNFNEAEFRSNKKELAQIKKKYNY